MEKPAGPISIDRLVSHLFPDVAIYLIPHTLSRNFEQLIKVFFASQDIFHPRTLLMLSEVPQELTLIPAWVSLPRALGSAHDKVGSYPFSILF